MPRQKMLLSWTSAACACSVARIPLFRSQHPTFFCRISPPVFLVHVVSWSWPTCWRQRCAHAPGLDRVSHPFRHSRVSVVKNLPAIAGDLRDLGSIPGSGRFPWRGAWQPIPMFLPGESHGQRSLAGYSPQGCKELDTTEGT